jgi:hypothetical protein
MRDKLIWWNGEDLIPFFKRVDELGAKNVRIEYDLKSTLLWIKPKNGGDGKTLKKGPQVKNGGEPFNDAHVCPPICPPSS